jgi:hypothetical protein
MRPFWPYSVESFEPGNFLPHSSGHPAGSAAGRHLDVVGQQAQQPCWRKRRMKVRTVSGCVGVS